MVVELTTELRASAPRAHNRGASVENADKREREINREKDREKEKEEREREVP